MSAPLKLYYGHSPYRIDVVVSDIREMPGVCKCAHRQPNVHHMWGPNSQMWTCITADGSSSEQFLWEYTVGRKIIRALEIIRARKLIPKAVLWNE